MGQSPGAMQLVSHAPPREPDRPNSERGRGGAISGAIVPGNLACPFANCPRFQKFRFPWDRRPRMSTPRQTPTRREIRKAVGPRAANLIVETAYDFTVFKQRGFFARFAWLLFGR